METAYLAFRTIFVLVGDVGKTRDILEELMEQPSIENIISERGDRDLLKRSVQKVTYSEADKQEMGQEDELYSQEELLELRQQAREESITQDMWKQYNVFQQSQAGVWRGIWTDYKYQKVIYPPGRCRPHHPVGTLSTLNDALRPSLVLTISSAWDQRCPSLLTCSVPCAGRAGGGWQPARDNGACVLDQRRGLPRALDQGGGRRQGAARLGASGLLPRH